MITAISIEAKTGNESKGTSRVLWAGHYPKVGYLEDIAELVEKGFTVNGKLYHPSEAKAVGFFNYGLKIQGFLNPERTKALAKETGKGLPPELKEANERIKALPPEKRQKALDRINAFIEANLGAIMAEQDDTEDDDASEDDD